MGKQTHHQFFSLRLHPIILCNILVLYQYTVCSRFFQCIIDKAAALFYNEAKSAVKGAPMEDTARYLEEICLRAASRNIFLFSRFLNLSEQKDAQIAARRAGAAFVLFGGAADCERKMLGVGGDEAPEGCLFPLVCLKVTPRSARFASPIAHRDVLGSLMGLGIERELIGDIVVREDGAYIFCTDKMAHFISTSLVKIGNTDVNCIPANAPEGPLRSYKEVRIQVTSPRIDAIVAHLFRLSRGDAQTLFRQGKIMVDDSECQHPDYALKEGQVLSVRGFGRARYMGIENISKKGKSNLLIHLYA